METYQEHYNACRAKNPILGGKYNSIYDLTVDRNVLDKALTPKYYKLVETIRNQISEKISDMKGCFVDNTGHAIRVNDWKDISEIKELIDILIPIIEKEMFGCPVKIEFLHPYRNIPSKNINENNPIPKNVNSSWKWHYDDCPDEFIKLFLHLNKVTDNNGCLKYIEDAKGNIPKLKSFRQPGNKNASKQIYEGSRIPDNHINDILGKGGKVINATGEAGSYAIHSANILHRASCPQPNTEPRDVLFFFIRPSLKLNNNSLETISSYLPNRDVKRYNLD